MSAGTCPRVQLAAGAGEGRGEPYPGGELKEEDWSAAARMDEFNELRRRWADQVGSYPLLMLLDAEGKRHEEMKQAIERLEAASIEPTLANWFADTRPKA